jgi:hypothetical protein
MDGEPGLEVHTLHGPPTTAQLDALAKVYPDIRPETYAAAGAVAMTVHNRRTGKLFEGVGFQGVREHASGFKVWTVARDGKVWEDEKRPGKPRRFNIGPADLIVTPALRQASKVDRLTMTEGESDLLALLQAGDPLVVTSTAGGGDVKALQKSASALQRWAPSRVIVWGDADTAGREGAKARAEAIKFILADAEVRWRTVPGEPESGRDLRDLFAEGADLERLAILEAEAEEVSTFPATPAAKGFVRRYISRPLSTIDPEGVEWLWSGRIPKGMLSAIQGPPNVLKTTIALHIGAKVSRGHPITKNDPVPGGAADVVIITAEDDWAKTIRPRLGAASADLARVHTFEGETDDEGHLLFPSIPGSLHSLEELVVEKGAELVIIDGIGGYLSRETDSHRDKDVRGDLLPLADFAHRTGAAVLLIMHLNKNRGASAMNRGMGSIAFTAVCRSVLVADKDRNDPEGKVHVLARVKGNLSADPGSLEYQIEPVHMGEIETIRIAWGAPSTHSADSLLAENIRTDGRQPLEEAKAFLTAELSDGPRLADDLFRAASDCGITRHTLKNAKAVLRVKSAKDRILGGNWSWAMP